MAMNLYGPEGSPLTVTNLVLDFNGTLACDGCLIPGVPERLQRLANRLRVYVATADTYGTVTVSLQGIGCEVRIISEGVDKAKIVLELGPDQTAVIGNGCNDIPMFRSAALSIAVLGPEGMSAELIASAHVIAPSITCALDLLLEPLRLKATLRS